MITISWGWLSRTPAPVTCTNRALCFISAMLAAPTYPIPGPQTADQLVDDVVQRPFVRHAPFDSFRDQLVDENHVFLAVSIPAETSRLHSALRAMPRCSLNLSPWWNMISPGLSSVPASKPPSITQSAPAPIAFAISPE